jgi:hypothetical protein
MGRLALAGPHMGKLSLAGLTVPRMGRLALTGPHLGRLRSRVDIRPGYGLTGPHLALTWVDMPYPCEGQSTHGSVSLPM